MSLSVQVIPGRVHNGRFTPADDITDRAKRYRANNAIEHDNGHCFACGAPHSRDVAHIDGNESNNDPRNLARSCRSCNVKMGRTLNRAGVGIKTRQYNPKKGAKSPPLGAYINSLLIAKGDQPGNVTSAVRTLHETSPAQRSAYAKQIWRIRKERYGPSGRSDGGAVPF